MRIEKINENKIRIFVTFDDLEERDIDLSSFNYNSPETQELFWDLMEQAEVELGFETQESQLCIEAVSDVEQGFVITITKLDEEGEFESIQKFIKNRYRRNELRNKRKSQPLSSTVLLYHIEQYDDLCIIAKHLLPIYQGSSRVYKWEKTYYLALRQVDGQPPLQTHFDHVLYEYADRISNVGFFEGYLNEYGTILVDENALQTIASFS